MCTAARAPSSLAQAELVARRRRRRRAQAGFTLMEVLVALVVFAISVVGLVALESRSIESQKAAREIRDAERVAQDVMAELMSRGFTQLLAVDFAGAPNPEIPYSDLDVTPVDRLRDMGLPPADIDPDDEALLRDEGHISSTTGQFAVFRTVDWVLNAANPPSNPPVLGTDEGRIPALTLEVVVMWIDYTNPAYPPPTGIEVTDLLPELTDPSNAEFRPWVGYVTLRNVRANDTITDPV